MKPERWIIAVLLILLGTVVAYYAAPLAGLSLGTSGGGQLQFVLPTASGLAVGQSVPLVPAGEDNAMRGAGEEAGRIASILPITQGVLVTVNLDLASIPSGVRAILRPSTPPKPSVLELAGRGSPRSLAAGTTLRIPADLQLGPPEGLVEPVPEWPLESP